MAPKPRGRKRKLSPEEQENLGRCFAVGRASDATIQQVWNIASELRSESPGETATRAQARTVQQDRLQDGLACYAKHFLPGTTSGQQVPVYVADLRTLLQYAITCSTSWAVALKRALQSRRDQKLTAVLYHDEVISGNILAPRKDKKIMLLYLGFKEMRTSLHKEAAWLTMALLQHNVLEKVEGGMSCFMALFVRDLHKQRNLDGFPLTFPSGETLWTSLATPSLFLSDQEAQRATWGVKGSGGLKPCMFCGNVLCRDSNVGTAGFVEISEPDASKFLRWQDEEIFRAFDRLAAVEKKGDQKHLATVLGISFLPTGLLAPGPGQNTPAALSFSQ